MDAAPKFSAAEYERGRRLFVAESRFIAAADNPDALPRENLPEVAFVGRSNVGKSSLLNKLTNRRGLARTSRTPGRTRTINLFVVGDKLTLVDLPGYGFAAVSQTETKRWGEAITAYLRRRNTLKRVLVLIDARHGLKDSDLVALDLIAHQAVSAMAVLTKADKVKAAELAETKASVVEALSRHPTAFPDVFVTSAETGAGMGELRAALAGLAG